MIRKYEPKDLDAIMDIWLTTNIVAHSFIDKSCWEEAADMVKSLLPLSDLFVYQNEDTILGFMGITDGFYIAGLFVDEKHQSQDIGRKLLDYGKTQFSSLELDVFVENKKAIRFYERNGFSFIERKMNPDFNQEEYHMTWAI